MSNQSIFIVFPNQLFKDISLLKQVDAVYLVEEFLFFKQYKFHKQKLVLHRASMKYYEAYLQENNIKVHYIEATSPQNDISILLSELKAQSIEIYDVCDNWLHKKIMASGAKNELKIIEHTTPLFINSKQDIALYFGNRTKYVQSDFYALQRKKLKILVDEKGKPEGGKWSFDAANRLKYPKGKIAPTINFPAVNDFYKEAIDYVTTHYAHHYGHISSTFIYPTTHEQSEIWLADFLETRFEEFGAFEDAIVDQEHTLHHSILTPMLNIGLLLPLQIVNAAIDYGVKNNIALNSVEGFIRQIIGWREFIRGVYLYKGSQQRTTNYWQCNKQMPASFYTGTTGIEPIDSSIKKLLDSAYNHHIERLMILGNFMLLRSIHPDQVYQWFMEMYIDAYDWVMVPNVYGMSQFADAGLMATKPYISGSSYVLKMSNYKKGPWTEIWDALFWHFMNKHRQFFLSNPRLGMLIKTYDSMSAEKKEHLNAVFERFDAMN